MKLTFDQLKELAARPEPSFDKFDPFLGDKTLWSTAALLGLIVYDYENGETYEHKDFVRKHIALKLLPVLTQSQEPCFDNGHNWGYPLLCQSFALIKNKRSLWELFNADLQGRMTTLMKMFVHMWNFGCNKYNGFKTGISLRGNYQKNANPNYMLSNEALILPCVHYFGNMHEVCQIMIHHDYDSVITELKKYNFTNALEIWTTPGFELPDGSVSAGARELFGTLELRRNTPQYFCEAYVKDNTGNVTYAGRGKGCTLPYYYHERNFDNKDFETYPYEIYEHILNKTFSGGLCTDNVVIDVEEDFKTSITDGTTSPYVGLDGMMWEFRSWDFMGTRSSLFHCEIDFYLINTLYTTLKLLGINIFIDPNVKARALVGMNDCLYKMAHGYQGYSMGKPESPRHRLADMPEWRQHWQEEFGEE